MRNTRAAILSILLLTLTAAFALAAQSDEVTIEGTLVTSFCYLGNDTMGPDHKECAMECTREGAPAGIVTDEGDYTPISAYVLKIVDHMEERVRVTGEVKEGMLLISKFKVRDGDHWKEVDAGPSNSGD